MFNVRQRAKSTTGHVPGTLKHSETEKIVRNYQDNVRNRGLILAQNYLGGRQVNGNLKGSTRLDVYDPNANRVYDYKFVTHPGRGLLKRQVNKIINQGSIGLSAANIREVNPK